MELRIERLTTDIINDFFCFFENAAFTDHEEWANCYCLEPHIGYADDEGFRDRAARRAKAAELIESGAMQGYLAYHGDEVVGWCNANDKMNFPIINGDDAFRTLDCGAGVIKSVYCFDIAPEWRGRQMSSLILDRVCEDAKRDGYSYIECYPFTDTTEQYQYHGTKGLYVRHGFEFVKNVYVFDIMQKKL